MSVAHAIDLPDLGEPDPPTCPECGARFHRTLIRFELEEELLGYFPADRCENGHEYLTEEGGEAIHRAAAQRGSEGEPERAEDL